MRTYTKYAYWKWLLLSKHLELSKLLEEADGYVLVHNTTKDTIYVYNINRKKNARLNLERLTLSLFDNLLPFYLEIGELKEFYKSLPTQLQQRMWDCLA